jgi:hypothetical protein
MDGRTSELAKRIEAKYGKVKLNETYEIDGKRYKLTNGEIDDISNRVSDLIREIEKQ